jgi:hypothetical protein
MLIARSKSSHDGEDIGAVFGDRSMSVRYVRYRSIGSTGTSSTARTVK